MDTIILPLVPSEGSEKITSESEEINIAALLSCSQRTIRDHIKSGILPKPIKEKDGIYYFSREAVCNSLGIKELEEPLVSIEYAMKVLKITISQFEKVVKAGIFTEIKIKGLAKSKRYYIKREIMEHNFEIEEINKSNISRNEIRFTKILFTEKNVALLFPNLSEREAFILVKVHSDDMSYEDIAKECGISRDRVRQIFEKTRRRVEHWISFQIPRMMEDFERQIEARFMEEIWERENERFMELERKIKNVNRLIVDAQDKIKVPKDLRAIKVSPDHSAISKDDLRKLLKTKLVDLDISARSLNCLNYAKIMTLGELTAYMPEELMEIKNFGKTCMREMKSILKENGLKFHSLIPMNDISFKEK